jgi:hypothetical protein
MKNPIPTPVVIGVVVVVVAAVALFFMKGAMAEPQTPRPDRAKMMGASAPATP